MSEPGKIRGLGRPIATLNGSGALRKSQKSAERIAQIAARLTWAAAKESPCENTIRTALRIRLTADQTFDLINRVAGKKDLVHSSDRHWAVQALEEVLENAGRALKDPKLIYSFMDVAVSHYGSGGMGDETCVAFPAFNKYFLAAERTGMDPKDSHQIGVALFRKHGIEGLYEIAEALPALKAAGYSSEQRRILLEAMIQKTYVDSACRNIKKALAATRVTARLDAQRSLEFLLKIIDQAGWFAGAAFATLPPVVKSGLEAGLSLEQVTGLYRYEQSGDADLSYFEGISSAAKGIKLLHAEGLNADQICRIIRLVLNRGSHFNALERFVKDARALKMSPDELYTSLEKVIRCSGPMVVDQTLCKFGSVIEINRKAGLNLNHEQLLRLTILSPLLDESLAFINSGITLK